MLRLTADHSEFKNLLVLLGVLALMLVPVLVSEILYAALN